MKANQLKTLVLEYDDHHFIAHRKKIILCLKANQIMKATAKIKELNSDKSKLTIIRNLSRIMEIRILDIDIENRTISFIYDSILALEKVKRELSNIGLPMLHCNYHESNNLGQKTAYKEQLLTS